jgi:hypothetical protein
MFERPFVKILSEGGNMSITLEMILTIIGLSFWFLFPIGMFFSVSRVDKNTDQLIRLEHHELETLDAEVAGEKNRRPVFHPVPFDWHHPFRYFGQWPQHE